MLEVLRKLCGGVAALARRLIPTTIVTICIATAWSIGAVGENRFYVFPLMVVAVIAIGHAVDRAEARVAKTMALQLYSMIADDRETSVSITHEHRLDLSDQALDGLTTRLEQRAAVRDGAIWNPPAPAQHPPPRTVTPVAERDAPLSGGRDV